VEVISETSSRKSACGSSGTTGAGLSQLKMASAKINVNRYDILFIAFLYIFTQSYNFSPSSARKSRLTMTASLDNII
jgi:hypothetical protein